jgi:ATP-dependent exoDNAse (exonuclease V) beta subunit
MNLKIISAGAGSGKTYRLTEELVRLLGEGMSASGIIATTFTRKAAAELQERVRVSLLQEGFSEQADELTNALIGTVHSLGVKLLRRFAFEAGVSPEVSIIAQEDEHIMFNQSLATVLTSKRVAEMDDLSSKLGLNKRDFFDWRKKVHEITSLARANDFSIEVLEKSKKLSFETFGQFLGAVSDKDADWFNDKLTSALTETISILEENEDSTKVTSNAVSALRIMARELDLRKFLYWHQWAKISKIKVGAKSRDDIEDLGDFASSHDSHPDFHRDVQAFTDLLFDIAIEAINEYSGYKNKRGLIDYTDMEASVNKLLDNKQVQAVLKEELSLLMVDEFQDTSPIQLSVFLKLAHLADSSIWVGDPKQSIYGFRGAEPRLMEAIIQQSGGVKPEDIQRYSWRTREQAVYASNAIFTKAFQNMPADQVALIPKRAIKAHKESSNKENEPAEMGNALIHWHFKLEEDGRQPARPWTENCIARALSELLEEGIYIMPKGEKECRKAKPGDVAILCRSNSGCQTMAEALSDAGLRVAIARSGLLNTAESKLILACLKYLLNPRDSLAIAEILLLAAGIPVEEIIEDRLEWLQKKEEDHHYDNWVANQKYIEHLDLLRSQTAELSSAEILNLVLEELDLRRIITSWGNQSQRLDNVETLRKFALDYEEGCNRMHSAASLGGFYLWLDEQERNEKDLQGAGLENNAVNVLTYHKSKGLEWPIVICHNLDDNLRSEVWGMEIVPEKEDIDLQNVLGDRWLRYWINPYADQYRNTKLETRINESDAKAIKLQQSLKEEARLLYVAITRARDYIILPSNSYPTRWLNRVWHDGKEDYPVLDPDSNESPWEWNNQFLEVDTKVFYMPRTFEPISPQQDSSPAYFTKSTGKDFFIPYKLDFNHLEEEIEGNFRVVNIYQYSAPFLLEDDISKNALGQAMTAFFIADAQSQSEQVRIEMAEQLLYNFEVDEALEPIVLVERSAAFNALLEKQFQAVKKLGKYPMHHFHKGQLFEAELDNLIETPAGQLIIHNDFLSGEEKLLRKRALALGMELEISKEAVKKVIGEGEVKTMIHFILDGLLIEIEHSK